MSIKEEYKTKIIDPIIGYLRQGADPNKLSLTIVLGFAFGIIPFLGVNTAICILLSIILRLNMVVIQLINYTAFPLQILLIVPFFKAGEAIFGTSENKIMLSTLSSLFGENWLQSLTLLLKSNLKALLLWLILIVPISIFSYFRIRNVLINWFGNISNRSNQ
jgi:uncharacterized protein (DUF2062 family)